MSYEIPQQLQHQERIIFGLTFSQLGWAALWGSLILLILTRKGSFTSNFILAVFPAMSGIFFVFFDASRWLGYAYHFLRFRSASLTSSKMQRLAGVKKIEKGVVHSEVEVAVLQIEPLNFAIKTGEGKEAIIAGFQRFLNSLDFPVQFVVTTNSIDLSSYLQALEKRVADKALFANFSLFLRQIIAERNMRNRLFYVVIQKKSDLEIQSKLCIERLQGLGLQVHRLNDRELLSKFRGFFNGSEPERNPQEQIDNALHYLIAPNYVKDNVDSLIVNERFYRIIAAVGYPRMVETGFLDRIISSNDDFDIAIHVEPYSIESTMILLNRELQKQRGDLYADELKKSINPSLEIKYHDTRKVLEELQKGIEKLFNVSLYIICKGASKEEMDLLTKKVESELNALMIIPSVPIFRQVSAYKSVVPLAHNELAVKRNITTHALSAFFPFTSPFLTVEPEGVMLGLNKNKVPFIKDIFALSNANGLILATSGAGKSYFTKLLIARQLLNGTRVMVIDPQAEYLGLAGKVDGEVVTISRTSETIINPLDLMGHDFVEKRLALMDLFRIMFGELSEVQKSILDRALTETYARKGITGASYKGKKPPILADLSKVLDGMDKKASQMEKITYRALLNRLYMYTEGVFSFLNTQSAINFESRFVCFNIGDMPKQVKPVIMYLILDYVYMKMKESKERKLLIIDEAWSLLSKAEEASYIFEIVKTCRKFNMGLLLITQDVADLLNSNAGHAVLANSSYSLLLRQKPAVIESVVKIFNLSEMEKNYLLTATQGRGILIMDNDHQELEVVASPKEHEIITTNPNEAIQKQAKQEELAEINAAVNLEKKLYYGRDLDIEQKNYLANHGYKPGFFVPIGKPRQEECWIKANDLESLEHTFLVENIRSELLKHTNDISVNVSTEPDIVFKDKGGMVVALEIETGKQLNDKKKLQAKFHEAKLKYKKLCIVLTDVHQRPKYAKLVPETPLLIRKDIPQLIETLFSKKKKT